MIWQGDHLITADEKKQITETVKDICKRYKVKLPTYIEISKRLRTNDGVYRWWAENGSQNKIQLAYKHLCNFGMDSLIKVLKHECAHHICSMKGKQVDHGRYFRDLCLKLGACLSDDLCTGKYSKLAYRGIDTPYIWMYKCPDCKVKFKTKKAIQVSDRVCAECGCSVSRFEKWRL